MEWRQDDWADAADTIQQLRDMGFQILQAQHPFIHEGSLRYKALKDSGFLNKTPEGHAGTFDHSNPQARQAWWELTKRFYQDGIRGYWTEMGELEKHPEGTESHLGPREKVHNTYAMLWAKGLYDGQTQDFNEQVMILSRTAYAGMQRYGTALWSGDINSEWEVLRKQIKVGQGVCLSGIPFWCTDIGGFFTGAAFSPEMYIRWVQWGVFCPLCILFRILWLFVRLLDSPSFPKEASDQT